MDEGHLCTSGASAIFGAIVVFAANFHSIRISIDMTVKLYFRLSKPESLTWLKTNDPEYDWASQGLNLKQLQQAIADNLHSFGEEAQSLGLKARLPLHRC